jgi:shikimate kinase
MRNAASSTARQWQRASVMRRTAPSRGEHGAPHRELGTRIDRPLVLVGMMGAGKSTIGRRLATALGLAFADADEEIVEAAQMSIPEIFDAFGEAYFRDGERRVIARMLEGPPRVIATGGGAFAQDDTRALILERGIAVWLDSDLDTLVDRVTRKDTRPLLRGGNPRAILTRLLEERRPAYAEAPIRVTSGSGPPAETVARILEALDAWK